MDSKLSRPVIGITMGDPAGIGPEIVMKALQDESLYDRARPLVIGDARRLEQAARWVEAAADLYAVSDPSGGRYRHGTVDVVDLANVPDDLAMGRVQAAAGRAACEYIEWGARQALAHRLDALATAPIHKEAIRAAGTSHIGHTEMLADLTASSNTLTMFQVEGLRIFFLTRHVSLQEACRQVTRRRIVDTVRTAMEHLRRAGLTEPLLAVAGLNPHSGDGGLLGREEIEEISPAVADLIGDGYRVVGPIPADSVFHQARQGAFDAVLALYHDQGHIAAKCISFEKTVSVTLGLPFIRTSVDHGTAYDIAGTGRASAVSMVEAIRAAADLAGKG